MNKILSFLKTKWIGFYLTAAAAFLVLLLVVFYPVFFAGKAQWGVWVILFPIFGLLIGAGLYVGGFFIKGLEVWAPGALAAGSFIGFIAYMTKMFNPLIEIYGPYHTMVYIPGLITIIVLFGTVLIASIAGMFFKQAKPQKQE